jgi:protein-tyrosine-phosphatase
MIKPKVLFLYSENSCFTQMAEAFLRDMAGDRFEAMSAEWKQPHWTLRR